MVRLCPGRAIINWKYRKLKVYLICIIYQHHVQPSLPSVWSEQPNARKNRLPKARTGHTWGVSFFWAHTDEWDGNSCMHHGMQKTQTTMPKSHWHESLVESPSLPFLNTELTGRTTLGCQLKENLRHGSYWVHITLPPSSGWEIIKWCPVIQDSFLCLQLW